MARAVGLDMVGAGWKPTVDNYLGRVTKPRILEAVREAKGEPSAQLIDHLKKGDIAKEAERLLDGAGWLPEPLRLDDVASEPAESQVEAEPLRGSDTEVAQTVEGGDAESLPAFLSEDDEATEGADEVEEIVAAE